MYWAISQWERPCLGLHSENLSTKEKATDTGFGPEQQAFALLLV